MIWLNLLLIVVLLFLLNRLARAVERVEAVIRTLETRL